MNVIQIVGDYSTERTWWIDCSRIGRSGTTADPHTYNPNYWDRGVGNGTTRPTHTRNPIAPVVHSLRATLDHDDPTVAKLAQADGQGEATRPTANDHHIRLILGRAHRCVSLSWGGE